MKILTFVDVHGNISIIRRLIKKAKNVDLLICCGDLSSFGKNFLKLISMFKKTNKPLLIIPGNHESSEDIRKADSKFDFVMNLHRRSYQFGKYLFFGYGGGGFSQTDKTLEKISKEFKKTIRDDNIVIFITHAPPYKTKLDLLDTGYRGSKSIRKAIEYLQPKFNFCGHLHETAGNKDKIKKTFIVNPGPEGKIIAL